MSLDPVFLNACTAQAIPLPKIFGIEVTDTQANVVTNASYISPIGQVFTKQESTGLTYCHVSVQYTHPRQNDSIAVTVYLPQKSNWSGRFVGLGGGGWATMMDQTDMLRATDAGFAAAQTDGGVSTWSVLHSDFWALVSPGNPDVQSLNNWASNAIHETAVIGKAVAAAFYDQAPSYSYWIGSSGGGRQGHMLAQRYPEDVDGVVALVPAINWAKVFATLAWPKQVMYELGYIPRKCEVEAMIYAAIDACDGLDGVLDGFISNPELCTFDPSSMIGHTYNCDGSSETFTSDLAKLIQYAWDGPKTADGDALWYGYAKDAQLASEVFLNTMSTSCSEAGECTPIGVPLSDDWFRYWLAADPDFDLSNMTRAEFLRLAHLGEQRYDSILGTRDPDLSDFRDAGGKIITWHGLTDSLIPYAGSIDYYERVRKVDATVDDYFRLFLAPGTGHGFPGKGPYPYGVLDNIIDWVEKGVAPEQLIARNVTHIDPRTGKVKGSAADNAGRGRPLCLYPRVQRYVGGDSDLLSSFRCVEPDYSYATAESQGQAKLGLGSLSIGRLFGL